MSCSYLDVGDIEDVLCLCIIELPLFVEVYRVGASVV